MKKFSKAWGIISLVSLCFSIIGPGLVVQAAIASTDYFQLTTAGNAVTMDAGGSLVFTVNAKVANGAAKTLAGADFATINIWPLSGGLGGAAVADVTAIGGGATLKASATDPMSGGTTAANIDGASDDLVAINIDGTGTGTFTVTGTSSFGVCVSANGAAINPPDTGDFGDNGTVPGQDCQNITVAAASTGADHVEVSFVGGGTASVGDYKTMTLTQTNLGGGLVTSAVTDLVVDLSIINITPGAQSGLIKSSVAHGLDVNDLVKFTSSPGAPTAYYVVSSVNSATTFKVDSSFGDGAFSNSNVIKVGSLTPTGASFGLDGGDVITANVASLIQLTESTSGISAGSIVALSGLCTGNYLVTNAVPDGAASTVMVIGPTACTTDAGTITKQTPSDDPVGNYLISDGAGAEAYVYSVGGEVVGNQTTTYLSDVALVNGVLNLVVVPTAEGTLSPLAASMGTLEGELGIGSLIVGAASALTINSYGPPNGQTRVPVHAPVDVMFNKNPDPLGTIFPLTNTTSSQLAFISGASAVSGVWEIVTEGGGGVTFYRAIFKPSVQLSASTSYTTQISKDFVSTVNLQGGVPALTDGGAAFNAFSFTTGLSGGSFTVPALGDSTGAGGFVSGFTGTHGGEFPPMAFLSYPQPRSAAVPTNIACVTVEFDRPMKESTLTTSNIYIRKLTAGVESAPAGTPVVTPLEGNESACISGYTFEANSKYRVVVSRSVTDEKGTQLAGMPESDGAAISGIGFGFENMGPFREEFTTGAGVAAAIAPNLMGLNLNQYKSAGSITGVPTGSMVKASFGQPLNPSTVNAQNITLKRGGSIPIEGSVFYDAMGNSVEFIPSSALSASVSYTFAISSSVTSVTGTAISPLTTVFTTDVADIIKPKLVFADADNYGVHLQFDELLDESSATDKTNYTVKTCSQAAIAADGTSCTGGGDVTIVSLFSGITAHYERTENSVWMDGFTLTAGDGFYIAVSDGVTDVTLNGMHATDNKSWTGTVMGADKFAGGQGMFNMGTIGMKDFDMKVMGMKPINAMPMNTMAGATTKYFINIPIGTAIPTGGYVELTFPAGFVVTGVKRDAQSPMNADFNGPSTGTVTFATDLPTITGLTDGAGAQASDGVGYVTAARKVIVKLSGATQASDFLHIDLDGITNSSEPKSFDTSGYSINIKTFNTSNVLLEAMTTMPFFISSAGTGSVAGQVGAGETGLNDVVVFLHSPMTGPMQTVTAADGAGGLVVGADDGEYKFENLPAGQYFISTEPLFTSGATEYYGNSMPEPVTVAGDVIKDISVTAATATGKATQPVSIMFPSLPVSSLGFNDSIDIFAFNPSSRVPVIKTVTRDTLGASPYSVNLYLPVAGDWNIGIGPAMPRGPGAAGKGEVGGWMPSQNVVVNVAAADLGGAAKSARTLSMGVSNKSITGKVLDASGTAVANAEVFAYDPQAGKNAHTTAQVDGTFSLSVTEGSYKVGAFLPGMPSSQEMPVRVGASAVYVNGSTTASTGSSGAAPLYLRVAVPDYTIQGRVATSGGSPIAGSAVWAHRTDSPSRPLNAITDSSGNYSFYVTAGTWKVEGDAPNYGYLGSKTIVVTTASLSSQNFEVASTLNTVSGTVDNPATSDDSGTIVYAYGVNGSAEAKTDTDGNYTLNLPDGTYDISAVVPGIGDLEPLPDLEGVVADGEVTVDGTESNLDFTIGTPRTFTVTLSEEATVDTTIGLFNESGRGNEVIIPAGSTSGTITVQEGTYYLDADVAGADFEDLTISGAEFNIPNGALSTNDQVNIDGESDNLTITLPEIFTITGQVTVDGEGVNDAYVSIFDEATKSVFGVMTANDAASGGLDGEYSIRVQAGTYSIAVDKSGYTTTPIDLTVTADAADNDFVLAESSLTIAGTVYDGETPVAGAPVWAEKAGGGFVATETSTDGTYILNVDSGVWVVNGVSDGYAEGDALTIDVSTSQTLQDLSLTELSGDEVLGEPQTESITPGTGGTIVDDNTSVEIFVPPNALGTSSDSGQISVAETNAVMQTATANPIGNGVEVSAFDNDGNPITTLSDDVTIVLPITLAALVAEGVDTPAELSGMRNAYWDDSAATWASLPTDTIYYNASREVIPENVVAAAGTLAAAGVATVELTSRVSHFTTFASIVSSGATPPATPAGLTATAGDGQVVLTWTKNSEEDMSSYNIWEANVTEGILTTSLQSACGVTTCSKTITGLTNGTAYAFQIAAVDTPDGNTSAYATAVNATPAAAAASSSAGGGGVVLNRNNSSDATATTSEADVVDGEVPAEGGGVVYGQTPFVDISSHWAKDYIEALYLNKIVSGSDASHFNPENTTTRAELTKMVVNAFGISLPSEMPANFFSDVEFSKWYASYIAAAKNEGFVVGYSDNTFKPNGVINRAEAIKLLVTALGVDLSGVVGGSFPDVKASDWYSAHVSYAAENGIVVGDENGKFSAAGSLTRAMAAKMISLILEKK